MKKTYLVASFNRCNGEYREAEVIGSNIDQSLEVLSPPQMILNPPCTAINRVGKSAIADILKSILWLRRVRHRSICIVRVGDRTLVDDTR